MITTPAFDGGALVAEVDVRRAELGFTWSDVAVGLTRQSAVLRAEIDDHDVCAGALVRTVKRGSMSCQYALMLLQWLGRAPEEFLVGDRVQVGDVRLPTVGTEARMRWDLPLLYAAANELREERGLTWTALAAELGCTPNRLTNLRTARQADMDLTMRLTQWLGRPAAAFVHAATW